MARSPWRHGQQQSRRQLVPLVGRLAGRCCPLSSLDCARRHREPTLPARPPTHLLAARSTIVSQSDVLVWRTCWVLEANLYNVCVIDTVCDTQNAASPGFVMTFSMYVLVCMYVRLYVCTTRLAGRPIRNISKIQSQLKMT
jgi:hypothetical protein